MRRINDLAGRVCTNHEGLILFCHRFIYREVIPFECMPILVENDYERLSIEYTWNETFRDNHVRQRRQGSYACDWHTGDDRLPLLTPAEPSTKPEYTVPVIIPDPETAATPVLQTSVEACEKKSQHTRDERQRTSTKVKQSNKTKVKQNNGRGYENSSNPNAAGSPDKLPTTNDTID